MPQLADLLAGSLELFEHDDVDRIVAALSDETERVELKSDWPAGPELAHDCCALANGLGGVIIIGYEDPSRGRAPHPGVDGSSKAIDSKLASVHSLTAPSVHCIMRSYLGSAHTAVVVVVPPTESGPHEYVRADKPNLPVRRGRSKKSLSLSEIFALRHRAESFASDPPEIGHPIVSLDTKTATYWGVEFTPIEWPLERLVFTHEEDVAFTGFWGGLWNAVPTIRANGIELSYDENSGLNFSLAVHVDGSVVMTWYTNCRQWMYFLAFLEHCYDFASFVFFKLGLSPRALMRVKWSVATDDRDPKEPFPDYGELLMRLDFSRDALDEVTTFVVEQTHRLGGRSQSRETIRRSIETRGGQPPPDPRSRWDAL
jgi:hypothetical protein